MMTKKLDQK